MKTYQFEFYKKTYYDQIEELILNSYQWENPIFGLSRFEFSAGLHPAFLQYPDAWERTVGVYFHDGIIVACAINEGNDEGEAFFLFRDQSYAEDDELLSDMIHFAKTTMVYGKEDRIHRYIRIYVPNWNLTLSNKLLAQGFVKEEGGRNLIRSFSNQPYPVKIPEGYRFIDGNSAPAFFAANVHMASFSYSYSLLPNTTNAFADLRKQKHYNPGLNLFVVDPEGRPVGMAIIWYDPKMTYCELEPLGVAFWERRKGLATAILNELSNRVKARYPQCKGMLGGDQPFYLALGYQVTDVYSAYRIEMEVYPSWDTRSNQR